MKCIRQQLQDLAYWKNRLLINEKYGSYVFIAELLTSAELDFDDSEIPVAPEKCIGCGKCIRKCAFLAGEREFCLSELNQRKGFQRVSLRCPCSKNTPGAVMFVRKFVL